MHVSTKIRQFRDIDLGPHEAQIKQMLIDEDPGPSAKYGVGLQKLKEDYAHQILLSNTGRDRFEGHTCYKMVFGGYAWLVMVTGHKLPEEMEPLFIAETGQAYIHEVSVRDVGFMVDAARQLPIGHI